jgi:hypothetical protein
MENHTDFELATMFELSVFKSGSPPDEVAFFCYYIDDRFGAWRSGGFRSTKLSSSN